MVLTLGLASFLATLISYLAFLSYTPKVDRRTPALTTDAVPLIGSWGFVTRKWDFWKNAVRESKTGNFSFWLGKYYVVGMSGEDTRKLFLDDHRLDFVSGAELVRIGPDFSPPLHEIYNPNFHNGRSYFQRRLLDLQKSEQLVKRLPKVTRDARAAFEALARFPSSIINPASTCFSLVVKQGCRIVGTDEISDDPKRLKSCEGYFATLLSSQDLQTAALPWLPSRANFRRRYATFCFTRLLGPIVDERMKKGALRKDDALQTLVDNGDSRENIVTFLRPALFIVNANSGHLAGAMLNIMASHAYWQDRVYGEIKAAAATYSRNKGAPLVDQLDSLPLEAWESSFPSIDLCLKEAMRMWVAFPMIRKNLASEAIPIPRTGEVIPANGFVSYNSTDVHYNEEIYPRPLKYDPERFLEGREEFKKQNFGFLGWGGGRHPCLGMRWAKIQQNIILAYALAKYQWSGCHADGSPNYIFDRKTEVAPSTPSLPQGLYCKYVPREKA